MSSANQKLLLTCRSKSGALTHFLPALRGAGWSADPHLLSAGDPTPPWSEVGGLLLAGGLDIHPRHWDTGEPLAPEAEPDEARDLLEIPLIRAAWDRRLPILGICRGHQILNVALGGTLAQHIPTHYGCEVSRHQHGDAEEPEVRHRVRLDPASRLAALLGSPEVPVNSRHHQAVRRVAPGLRAVGWDPQVPSLVEAVEAGDPTRWVFGVQWHPENLVGLEGPAGDAARALFTAFVRALGAQEHP